MVSLEVGWLPCLAGIATLLTIIPLQAWISRQLGALRGRAVEQADARMRLAGESVNGALAMKLLCWEQPLCAALSRLRAGEARALSHIGRIRASSMALEAVNTTIVTFVTFTVYTAMGGQLHVPRVFYVLSLLHLPKLFVCSFFVNAVQTATEAMVAVKRIDAFLATPEPRPPTNNSQPAAAAPASGAKQSDAGDHAVPGTVALRGADYDATRPLGVAAAADGAAGAARKAGAASVPPTAPSAPPTLQGIELRLQPGELLAVVGAVGCGKTCLLAALLGELQPLPAPGGDSPDAGSPDAELRSALVVGSLAYCQQVPWIKAGSVRDNIVFGRSDDFDPAHYAAVLAACALEPDLKELPAGDATELGERGVNLSGGQKARMALARAAYSRAAVQLLDDPLSAVDPRVGHILFERCIRGLMAGATRVLVTHQRQYLPKCDRLAVLRGGRLLALGTFEQVSAMGLPELSAAGGLALDADAVPSEEEEGGQGEGPAGRGEAGVTAAAPGEVAVQLPQLSTADLAVKEAGASGGQEDGGEGGGSGGAARRQQGSTPSAAGAKVGGGGGSGSLVKDEEREMGTIGWAVYAGLCRRMGIGAVATVACGLVAGQGAMLAAEYWLALWAKAPPDEQRRSVWVLIFGLLVAAVLALGLGRSLLFFQANVAAATRIVSALPGSSPPHASLPPSLQPGLLMLLLSSIPHQSLLPYLG